MHSKGPSVLFRGCEKVCNFVPVLHNAHWVTLTAGLATCLAISEANVSQQNTSSPMPRCRLVYGYCCFALDPPLLLAYLLYGVRRSL